MLLPTASAVTVPLFDPINATDGLLLLHVPGVVASARVEVPELPKHKPVPPEIGATIGNAFTVTVIVAVPEHDPLE